MARHILVTGGSGGIGEAIAAGLIANGAEVTILARGGDRLKRACSTLGSKATGLACDLALQSDVRSAVAALAGRPIDGLVLNAAIVPARRTLTSEAIEETLAVNHLAPYLLTRLLMDRLAPAARVVVVGADPKLLARAPVDLDDLPFENDFNPVSAYMRSKNMNAMFAYALARRLKGRGVLVNAAHPGIIATSLARNATGLLRIATSLARPFLKDTNVGADTPLWLATNPAIATTGGFYVRRKLVETADHTRDQKRQERLWELSAQMVCLEA